MSRGGLWGSKSLVCPSKPREKQLLAQVPDLFSRVLFSFLPAFLATPLPPLFSAYFRPFLPLEGALFCRAKGTAQSLEGAVLGWTSPQSSGRKFLPEIRVKKGQVLGGISQDFWRDIAEVPENRGVPSDGLRRYGLSILKT